MGKSGRKLVVALVAFGAGGFAGLVAAAADESSAVSHLIRSGEELRATRTSQPTARPAKTERLNALPLLPLPTTSSEEHAMAPLAPAASNDASTAAAASQMTAQTSVARNALASSGKPVQRTKKSAAWTRRSEIIDPWSTRR
ncbi:MAG: hypothetical protein ACOY0T_01980 [Myxococcota bacterium]